MAQIYFAPPAHLLNSYKLFSEVTQNKFYKLIWLLKVYLPFNKTEVVLFLTKNEKEDPDLGVSPMPEVGCFFNIFKIKLFLLLYYSAFKKANLISLT